MSKAVDLDDRSRFIEAMSRVAWTVNVVTTDGPAGRAGVTVSAMTSVSADTPKPSLLVCIHHKSLAAQAILENKVFCINVLKDDQAHIADVFAGRFTTKTGDKFACATWTVQSTGAPRLFNALAAFDCRLINEQLMSTHHVFMGIVEDVFMGDKSSPLIHITRAYVKLGGVDEDPPVPQLKVNLRSG